jgi:hypothetical protein
MMDAAWRQLGLKATPPPAYDQVREDASELSNLANLWTISPASAQAEDWQNSYALIEFLTTVVGVPIPQLQRELGDITYQNWLLNVMGEAYPSLNDLEQEWQRFLDDRASS